MTPIPGEPLDPKPPELTTRDGRKVRLKLPGMAPLGEPDDSEPRGSAEPPGDEPQPPTDPGDADPGE